MIESTIKAKVNRLNTLIKQAASDEITAIEPDSTWESAYEFIEVRLLTNKVNVYYRELYTSNSDKVLKMTERIANRGDLSYMLSWVNRSIAKGYAEARKTAIREAREEAREVQ